MSDIVDEGGKPQKSLEGLILCEDRHGHPKKHTYEVISILGKGVYGIVVEVVDVSSRSDRYAIKIVNRESRFIAQANVMHSIWNRFWKDEGPLYNREKSRVCRHFYSFSFHKHPCFVFELLGYDLLQLLKFSKTGLSCNFLKPVSRDILIGLFGLHRRHIIHLDIKPENVVLSRETSDQASHFQKQQKEPKYDSSYNNNDEDDDEITDEDGKAILHQVEINVFDGQDLDEESSSPHSSHVSEGCSASEYSSGESCSSDISEEKSPNGSEPIKKVHSRCKVAKSIPVVPLTSSTSTNERIHIKEIPHDTPHIHSLSAEDIQESPPSQDSSHRASLSSSLHSIPIHRDMSPLISSHTSQDGLVSSETHSLSSRHSSRHSSHNSSRRTSHSARYEGASPRMIQGTLQKLSLRNHNIEHDEHENEPDASLDTTESHLYGPTVTHSSSSQGSHIHDEQQSTQNTYDASISGSDSISTPTMGSSSRHHDSLSTSITLPTATVNSTLIPRHFVPPIQSLPTLSPQQSFQQTFQQSLLARPEHQEHQEHPEHVGQKYIDSLGSS
ncbi:hypothetical protein ADUPG1_010471, partial [Aduncisulcus paluster]